MALVPLGLRALGRAQASDLPESYLPALEARRAREEAFDSNVIVDLRSLQPEFVLIGDSMAGSRVDATHLSVLLNYRGVAPLYYAATGPAFWYLALKNWVVASQVHPKLVIIFFRDENLTDPMFRVTGPYRASLDRVAHDREPALNDILKARTLGGWYPVHDAIASVYRTREARAWLEPLLTSTTVSLSVRPRARARLLARMNEQLFALDALRQMASADMTQAEDEEAFDFARNVRRSVLPAMFDVARHGQIGLAFVRVQRRPDKDGPPRQSPALVRYVRDLRRYIESEGGSFADDWGDPDQPLSIYADGDHVSRDFRERYTELFLRKHPEFFR
jgi:hypothetical protein